MRRSENVFRRPNSGRGVDTGPLFKTVYSLLSETTKKQRQIFKLGSLKFKTRKLKSILYDWDLPVAVPGVRAAAEL